MTVILVFGLAGSGKSSLARRLAEEFGLRKVHPSGIMRDLLEGREAVPDSSKPNEGYWETEAGAAVLRARLEEDEPVDVRVDKILLREVEKGNVVIDTWSLPWLTEKGTRIHLTAPLEVRAGRAAARAGIEKDEARLLIDKKDKDTRALFLRLYGFDILTEHDVFDCAIDTGHLTQEQVFARARDFLTRRDGF